MAMSLRQALTACALVSISLVAFLGGCAGTKEAVLPQDGPGMAAIYERHGRGTDEARLQQARAALAAPGPGEGTKNLHGWTRSAFDEIAARFPRLPNPTLILYVYPHLTAEGHPVPGYATSFTLYEGVEYALPGEAEAGP